VDNLWENSNYSHQTVRGRCRDFL